MSRSARRGVVAGVLGLVGGLLVLPAGAGPSAVEPCGEFAVAPDGIEAFCAGEVRDPSTYRTVGLSFFSTSDRGKTWVKAAAAGLAAPPEGNRLVDVFVSPLYSVDHAVYVQIAYGLFASVDRGMTFLPVDPLAWGTLTPFVARVPGAPAAAHTLFAHALRGDVDGANKSTIIDPDSRARTPVKGSPGRDREFVISPRFAEDGLAYVVAEHGSGLDRYVQLHGCNVALDCSTGLHRFPKRWTFDRIWLAPDFTVSRVMYASVRSVDGDMTLWWSRNGGRAFERWTAAERLLGSSVVTYALSGPAGTRELYLRVSGNHYELPTSPPYEQLFWSRDRGATWTRVSFGRMPYQPGARGSMPIHKPRQFPSDGQTPRGMIVAVGGGRVFSLGKVADPARTRPDLDTFFCTVDNGRSWASNCR